MNSHQMTRPFSDYTLEGQIALGNAIKFFRESEKPHWKPVAVKSLTPFDIEAEKDRWSQKQMAAIINREFGLTGYGVISDSTLHRLERPPINRLEPPLRLIELIAGLEIMINPKTQQPFTDVELLAVAKGLFDWKTGESDGRR